MQIKRTKSIVTKQRVGRSLHLALDVAVVAATLGALLRRVIWHGSTFGDVIQQYCEFIKSKYGLCSIVFDGYKKQTTKDHEHLRRSQKCQPCPSILLTEQTEVHYSKEDFFSNEQNKENLICLLSKHLRDNGHKVRQSENDADTKIVDEALQIACRGEAVTVVADDTDILVLLLHFWNSEMGQIFMRSEPKKQQNMKLRYIGQIANCLERNVLKYSLLIHAWGNCDTTSATFNQGKTAILKLVEKGSSSVMDMFGI